MLKGSTRPLPRSLPGQRASIERSGERSGLESPANAIREDGMPRGGVREALRRGARDGAGGGPECRTPGLPRTGGPSGKPPEREDWKRKGALVFTLKRTLPTLAKRQEPEGGGE